MPARASSRQARRCAWGSGTAWRGSHIAALLLVASLFVARPAVTASIPLPPWQRALEASLPVDTCRELQIPRVGQGVLELRFFAEPLLVPTGPDRKTTGASLLLAAANPQSVTTLIYDASGIYQETSQVRGPLRWMRRESELCLASGSELVSCARVAGEVRGTVLIAFGEGWEANVTGCAPFESEARRAGGTWPWLAAFLPLAILAASRSRRAADVIAIAVCAACFGVAAISTLDPWRLPSLAILPGTIAASMLVAAGALAQRRRPWRDRVPRIALALLVACAIARVPHPVQTAAPAKPVVPALWRDTANWHPRAAHQSLDFRGRPLSELRAGADTWIVLGGSVVFGDGVQAAQAFPAIAQDRLRGEGDPVVLNAGAQGWNIQNLDRLLADLIDGLPVTGIVVASILNNATLPIAGPEPDDCHRSLLRAYLCNVSRSQLMLSWPKAFLPKPRNPARYRATLRALLERERGLGRKVVLLDEVTEFDAGRGVWIWNTESYRAVARELASTFGVPFYPVADAIAEIPPAERFLDGIHPTPAAHLLLGRRLAEIVRAQ